MRQLGWTVDAGGGGADDGSYVDWGGRGKVEVEGGGRCGDRY